MAKIYRYKGYAIKKITRESGFVAWAVFKDGKYLGALHYLVDCKRAIDLGIF